MADPRCLLISNSFSHGGSYLEHCADAIKQFLGSVKRITFVPFALKDWDAYTALVREEFAKMGIEVVGIHENPNPNLLRSFSSAEAIFVGGEKITQGGAAL